MALDGLPTELDIIRDVSDRLSHAGIPYMLTGSLAMNYYVTPRMTRDIDVVLEVSPQDAARIVKLFEADYYVSNDAVVDAIATATSFNLIHRTAAIIDSH